MGASARHEELVGGDGDDDVARGEHLASQIALDRPGERAYRRALAFFLGSIVVSAIPSFLSSGVDLLDAPWHVAVPVTAAYVGLAVVRARGAARELVTRRPEHRAVQVVIVYAMGVLFAGIGGATLSWETTRLLDHRLDDDPGRSLVARRVAVHDGGGRGPRAEYLLPGSGGTFVVRRDDAPEELVVRVHEGALGYRWVAPPDDVQRSVTSRDP